MQRPSKLIFVDLETTGANHLFDRITEIGIVEVDGGQVTRWSTLVNPGVSIPPFIQNLTGISNDMVATAPTFESLVDELLPRLSGGLFIAHNARFDYSFLRTSLKNAGHAWRSDVLCTVKLSRQLNPQEKRHNLDTLMERHGLVAEARHRALADADLLWQFWNRVHADFAPETIDQALAHLLQRPAIPPHLDPAVLDDMPNTCGVYQFYGENDVLLYVGKSVNLRSRVLAHFAADMSATKEMRISQQIRRLAWKETAGELGALLEEARLVKQHQPLHNKRLRRVKDLCSWQLRVNSEGFLAPVLTWASEQDFGQAEKLYGLFATRRKADDSLRELAEAHSLCMVTLGLEKAAAPQKPCFAHQLQKCHGACVGSEAPLRHQARLESALAGIRVSRWPFPGAIGLREQHADGRSDVHVIDNWAWLGTARSEEDLQQLQEHRASRDVRPGFDHETYKILRRHITQGLLPITPLG